MAFDQTITNGYGAGTLGAVTNPAGQINSYAPITAIGTNQITIGTPATGVYETFIVGKEIMIHASAVTSGTDATKLGKYMVATITAVAGSVLTLSADPSTLFTTADLTPYVVQAITIAQFDTLTLSSGSITPLVYSVASKYGGILAIKCKTALVLSGGAINLVDKGIPVANLALRLLTAQETEMTTTGKTTGWENHITARQFLLNSGDGAVFIGAKLIDNSVGGATTRIGNTTAGVAYYPYSPNVNLPTPVKGGSTIFMVADAINNFLPSIISKGKNAGAGYGRCYIATNTPLPNDEGLYAQDCISDKTRLVATLGIKDFGDGILGNIVNPIGQLNSYAPVIAISGNVLTINNSNVSTGAYDAIVAGSEVMFHVSAKVTSGTANTLLGKFFCTKILSVLGSNVTLATPIPFAVSLVDYSCQLVTIPRFGNLTISSSYIGALAWDNIKKIGGLLVIKSNTNIDISGGSLNMAGKGLPNDAVVRPFLPNQCSGQQKDYLPLNQGGGAILLITKQLTGNANSRLGGILDGKQFGGNGGLDDSGTYGNIATGYATAGTGYMGDGGGYSKGGDGGGSSSHADGTGLGAKTGLTGGFGNSSGYGGLAGCSLFIVADVLALTILISILATGGFGGKSYSAGQAAGRDGGDGYGGGAGYGGGNPGCGGGGAGGPGTCFMYSNTVIAPDYTGAVI